jgi:hypothetical protein
VIYGPVSLVLFKFGESLRIKECPWLFSWGGDAYLSKKALFSGRFAVQPLKLGLGETFEEAKQETFLFT